MSKMLSNIEETLVNEFPTAKKAAEPINLDKKDSKSSEKLLPNIRE